MICSLVKFLFMLPPMVKELFEEAEILTYDVSSFARMCQGIDGAPHTSVPLSFSYRFQRLVAELFVVRLSFAKDMLRQFKVRPHVSTFLRDADE